MYIYAGKSSMVKDGVTMYKFEYVCIRTYSYRRHKTSEREGLRQRPRYPAQGAMQAFHY